MDPMHPARKHAKYLARDLSRCGTRYIVQISLKELGVPSGQDGFPLAKHVVLMICENRFCKLKNGAYTIAGNSAVPPMNDEQVYQAINRVVKHAWDNRNMKIWQCYFPKGTPGYDACPSNREFLFAIADFVDLWQGCCEEVNYVG
jgi:hypothetical protein